MSKEGKINVNEIRRSLQIKLERLMSLEREVNTYQQLIETSTILLSEYLKIRKAIKEVMNSQKKTYEGLINIGPRIFVPGILNFQEEKVVMDIGSGIAVKMSLKDAIERIDQEEKRIRNNISTAQKLIEQALQMSSKLQREIEQLRAYLLKLEKGKG
ncbi:MAG: prefoldin subunit alpha [Candidatus Njordarchaeia archaeon]|nr:prefoldin subunit alpha [Candidatus Korarchaeota archaeon]